MAGQIVSSATLGWVGTGTTPASPSAGQAITQRRVPLLSTGADRARPLLEYRSSSPTSCITRGAQGGFMGSAGLVYGAHKTGLRGAQGWFTVRVYGLSHDRFPTAGLWGAHNGFMGCTGRVYGLGHLVSNGGFTGFTG
jgi:hypothetical protein